MIKKLDYAMVPTGFVHCFNENCKNADRCLRHRIVRFIPDTLWAVSIVNPAHTSPTGKYAAFTVGTPVQYTVGMNHLLDQIPYLEAKRIKQRLLMTYGRNKFYQLKRKEKIFSPGGQRYIRQVFRAYGVEDEPVFNAWQSGYRWTKGRELIRVSLRRTESFSWEKQRFLLEETKVLLGESFSFSIGKTVNIRHSAS